MAGFKTHITVSTALGVVGGVTAATIYHVPVPTCLLAGGLCSVSGMLPDLDSDSGVPLRESIAFAAAVVPMLMVERFKKYGLAPELIVLAGAAIYVFIRFGFSKALKKYTVHRGMFHSIPAAIIAAEVAFFVCEHEDLVKRWFFAGAVLAGFMSHLILDEIWSIEFSKLRVKKSFGTAIKFWSDSRWANISAYVKVALLTYVAWNDPAWVNAKSSHGIADPQQMARDVDVGNPQQFAPSAGYANQPPAGYSNQPTADYRDPQQMAREYYDRNQQPLDYRNQQQLDYGNQPAVDPRDQRQMAREADPRNLR